MKFKAVALLLTVTLAVTTAAVPKIFSRGEEQEVDWERIENQYKSERDIETEVFGEVPATDFVPGFYPDPYIYDPEIPLEEDLQIKFQEICREYNVCYELVLAIIEHESRFIPNVVSKSGKCKGLMQINTDYHKCPDPFDPVENVKTGVGYLAALFEEHKDLGLVLDLYGGHKNAFIYHRDGTCSEMSQDIMIRAEELERKHGK